MDRVTAHWLGSEPAGLIVLASYLVAAAAHLAGMRRLIGAPISSAGQRGRSGRQLSDAAGRRDLIRQAALFQAGLLLAALAVVSPIGYLATVYVWVHGLQDLLLAFLAPALIVLGAPWRALRLSWPVPQPDAAAGRATTAPSTRWWLASPVAAAVAFNAVWLGWHLPAMLDPTRRNGAAALAELACYLGVGILFWLQLIGSCPLSPAAPPLRRFGLLASTVVTSTILGMILVFGSGLYYTSYAGPAHRQLPVVADQQLDGAVLWMGMLPVVAVAAVALLLRWLEDEDSMPGAADLGRPAARKSAWSSRPGLR